MMSLGGKMNVMLLSMLIILSGAGGSIHYFIHHHCYQEGGGCGRENITCGNDTIIDVVWCRIGYSRYWEGDGTRKNCSVTDSTCYKELDESAHNCSGLSVCELYTCSVSIHQVLNCTYYHATNFMIINYTCVEENATPTSDASNYGTSSFGIHSTDTRETRTSSPSVGDISQWLSSSPSSTNEVNTRQRIVVATSVTVSAIIVIALVATVLVWRRKKRARKTEVGTEIKENAQRVSTDVLVPSQSKVKDDSADTSIIDNVEYVSYTLESKTGNETELIENQSDGGCYEEIAPPRAKN